MTQIVYTRYHATLTHLGRAYARLGHASPPEDRWSAALLIRPNLTMAWGCKLLALTAEEGEEYEDRDDVVGIEWHVVAEAGELDYPPLRPDEEVWPALLEKHPVPTGERAERDAAWWGKGDIEELHRDRLRRHYLEDAYTADSIKRSLGDVNFDPLVRDWDVTARELADFLDTHRPPKLTTQQRVMAQGAHLAELEAEARATKQSLGRLMRNAAREQGDKPRRGFKADLSRWGGVSRPTVDAWLADGGDCEPAVHDEDGTRLPQHTHTTPTTREQDR
ncbi:hypothetical protein ACFY1V_31780 [Streptomyces sp. NPDC001255]|uniref:hypothetical protein n=1 Tax=Streptomyces sp. NPDC001255 TaxID=3364550 RepID=UPI0036B5D187